MTISKISIRNFRNIEQLDYEATEVNIIYGDSLTGKTTLFDAIALTDASDVEFCTMLKYSYGEPSKSMNLENLIRLNFFSHRRFLESFKIKLHFKTTYSKLLEIWRTDQETIKGIGGRDSLYSPYIFVCSSANPKKILPRAVSYRDVDRVYNTLKIGPLTWPLHYLSSNIINVTERIDKEWKKVPERSNVNGIIQSYIDHINHVECIRICKSKFQEGVMIKMDDREELVPLYGCSSSTIKILSIILFLNNTIKKYFLIDDIEKDLSDQEVEWLIPEICKLSKQRNIQLFVSTRRSDVVKLFSQHVNANKRDGVCLKLRNESTGSQEAVT
ncbi:MAG TPA: hypothetical protein VN843_36090 [Anaerolineales bacterium]|nr:hypothetical protein [Anaerolineales bacterium]